MVWLKIKQYLEIKKCYFAITQGKKKLIELIRIKENKAPSDDELLIDDLTIFCVGVLFYIVVNPLHTFDCTLSTLTGLRNII